MGHCISVYLIKKSELRDNKLETILNDKNDPRIVWTELDNGILATTLIPDIRNWGKDKTIAKIETDYFGGSGSQSARLFINNIRTYDGNDELDYKLSPINDVLKLMGVNRKDGMDEFDTIGLSKYRSNRDFNHIESEIGEL